MDIKKMNIVKPKIHGDKNGVMKKSLGLLLMLFKYHSILIFIMLLMIWQKMILIIILCSRMLYKGFKMYSDNNCLNKLRNL
jgi:hypothetical protein